MPAQFNVIKSAITQHYEAFNVGFLLRQSSGSDSEAVVCAGGVCVCEVFL